MAVKRLGKKGMFLTFVSIAIIAALIIIFTPSNINLSSDIPVVKARVLDVDEYVLDLENVYLERALQAAGRKTLIGLINYVKDNGFFSNEAEFENAFSEILLNGTYDNNLIPGMAGNAYNDSLDKIKTAAKSAFNVDTAFNDMGVADIRIYQTLPWFVDVDADVSFTVSTAEGTASWAKNITVKTEIEIEGLNDPYYLAKTSGAYVNKINKTNIKFDEWTVEKVKSFIRDGNYTHFQDSNAPSFLMRFYNDVSASSCCGIESLVNPNKLDVPDRDRALSYADYKFFPSWKSAPLCNGVTQTLYTESSIKGEFFNIKFDIGDLTKYKIWDDPLASVQQECPPPP